MAAFRSEGKGRSRLDRNRENGKPARGLVLAAFVFAGAAFLSGAVFGQQLGPPIPLFPNHPSGRGGGVTAAPLAPPSEGWSSAVSPPQNPLPQNFWQGTPRALADTLLAHLPVVRSPELQDLERRLLLSPGQAPRGPDAAGLYLPALRARLLLRLGALSAVRAVVAATPKKRRGPLWRIVVDANVIGGHLDRACDRVRERIKSDESVLWQRALVACQALEGKISEASLGLQILAEQQAPHDKALQTAVDALAHRPAADTVEQLTYPDPFLLRLIVASKRALAPPLIDRLSSPLALALARDDKTPPKERTRAALRAAGFGALAVPRLRAILSAEAGASQSDSGQASPGKPPLSAAQKFAAIGEASEPADRLSRISQFVGGLGGSGTSILGARLVAPQLRDIAPEPALAPFAHNAARLLLAAGEVKRAQDWVALVPAAEGRRLALLLHLLEEPGEGVQNANVTEIAQSVLSLALFSALGRPVSPAAWVALPPPSWSAAGRFEAPAVSWLDLAEAAQEKRIGETVLEAIIVAGSQGALSSDPVTLYAVISSLREVGLGNDARRLALEAALAADL